MSKGIHININIMLQKKEYRVKENTEFSISDTKPVSFVAFVFQKSTYFFSFLSIRQSLQSQHCRIVMSYAFQLV